MKIAMRFQLAVEGPVVICITGSLLMVTIRQTPSSTDMARFFEGGESVNSLLRALMTALPGRGGPTAP
jgi:hypothetical protein